MKKKIGIVLAVLMLPLVIAAAVAFADDNDTWGPEQKKKYEEYLKKQEEEKAKRKVGEGDMPDDLEAYKKVQEAEKKKKEEEKKKKEAGEPDDFYSPGMQKKKLGEGHLTAYDYAVKFPEERLKHVEEDLHYPIRYNDYYPSQYSLELMLDEAYFWEIVDSASNTGHFFIHQIINSMWQFLVVWDFQVISVVENGFSSDIVDAFADTVGSAVQQIAGFNGDGIGEKGLWGQMVTFMIVLAGAWAAYMLMIKRASTRAASGLGSTLLILVLALALFGNASGVMKYLNEISTGLSQEVLGIGVDLTPKSETRILEEERQLQRGITPTEPREIPKEAISFKMADRLYDMLIYEPYILLQYGKPPEEITQARAAEILKHKVMSDKRRKAVEKEVSEQNPYGEPIHMMTTAGTFERLTMVILLWITHLILGICLLVIAAAILFFQLLFIILTLFAPFALLMALVPSWTYVAINWFKRWVGAILMKLILSVFLSIILTISQVLYNTVPSSDYGYIWTITLQLILVIGVIWKRKDIFDILRAPVRNSVDAIPGERGGIRTVTNHASRVYYTARRMSRRGGGGNHHGSNRGNGSSSGGHRRTNRQAS
ncbi:TrbL/VirB6 plasmid conjugal transfer protein [Mycobacterium tuberculosis]|nr:TrbL/VirB6 plasmid conjugal transfer protein [Mycobacterium tuberculosis]